MSETTKNYGLHLTNDSSEKFLDWRERMNGTSDSNMMKIDAALGEKANNSVIVTTTLLASAWVGVDAPYTQELAVDGLLKDTNGIIDVAHDATAEQREIAREAKLAITGQEDGKLIIVADGEMPEFDIPVYIILLG
jgi:hypothetical protein